MTSSFHREAIVPVAQAAPLEGRGAEEPLPDINALFPGGGPQWGPGATAAPQRWVRMSGEGGMEQYAAVEFAEGSDYWLALSHSRLMYTPVRVVSYGRDTRGRIKRLFSKKEPANANGGVTLSQKFTAEGPYEDVTCRGSREGRLVASRDGKPVDAAEVRRRFPEAAAVESIGKGCVVYAPGEPRYQLRNVLTRYGSTEKSAVLEKGRPVSAEEAASTPLPPRVRAALEEFGPIVYEAGPSSASRVVICIAHLHGRMGDRLLFDAYDGEAAERYTAYQRSIADCLRGVERAALPREVNFFFETAPRRLDNLTPEERGKELRAFAFADVFSSSSSRCREAAEAFLQDFAGEIERGPYSLRDYEGLFRQSIFPSVEVSNDCARQGRTRVLNGDGRPENTEATVDVDAIRIRLGDLGRHYAGMAGAAGEEAKLRERKNEYVFHESQRGILRGMASLPPGSTAVLLYGAGHFASGTLTTSGKKNVKHFEEYLSWLPDTYVVAVEARTTGQLMQDYKNADAFLVAQLEESRTNMQDLLFIEEELSRVMMEFMFFASEWWHTRQQGKVQPGLRRKLLEVANLLLDLQQSAAHLHHQTVRGQPRREARPLQLAS